MTMSTARIAENLSIFGNTKTSKTPAMKAIWFAMSPTQELKECVADCKEERDYCTDCLEYLDQEGSKEKHKGHNTVVESCVTEDFLFWPLQT